MGELSAAAFESSIGRTPSGRKGLEVYAGVVPKNLRFALDDVYPVTRRACDALGPALWDDLVAAFLEAHPPRHADPNRCGDGWAAFLSQRRAAGADQPIFLEEIADYERICFHALTERVPGPERTLFVRRYEHDVPAYALETDGEDARAARAAGASGTVPKAMPVTVIVYRSTVTLKVRFLHPSRAQLFALARCQGELDPDLQARAGLTDEELDIGEHELRERGVLPEELPR